MNNKYYWIKLKTDFFNQDTIDFLLSQKNGCEYVVLYQMLCLKTANSSGRMATEIGEMIVPYDILKIARDTKYFSVDTVTIALELYKQLGLIYEESDGIYRISEIACMVGSETSYAEKKREYRNKKTQSRLKDNVSDNVSDIVRQEIRDKSIDNKILDNRDKISDIDNYESQNSSDVSSKDIIDLYHSICVSLPKVDAPLSYNTRRAIAERLKNEGYNAIKAVFEKAEESDFLTGKINKMWSADLNWLMNFKNFCKVLEDRYKNRGDKSGMDAETSKQSYQGIELTGITVI